MVIEFRISGDLKQVRKPADEQADVDLVVIAWLAEDVASLKAATELLDAVSSDRGSTVSTSK